jgi:hypothetical protein
MRPAGSTRKASTRKISNRKTCNRKTCSRETHVKHLLKKKNGSGLFLLPLQTG